MKLSGVSNYDYHHGKYKEYVSSSGLKNILVSPEYFKYHSEHAMKSSSSMNLGTAVHSIILEPDKFKTDITVMPVFKGTGSVKAKKEFLETVTSDTTMITQDQADTVLSIKQKFDETDELGELFSDGEAEVSIFWDTWKVRPDYLKENLVIDLKTTSKPLNEFNKACANYKYDLSAWFYCFGADVTNYKFVVVETSPPYNFVIYEPDAEFMAEGKEKALKAMDLYKECVKYGVWPGPDLTQTLSLPSWYVGR